MLNYEKLFAVGNVIGIKNCDTNKVYITSIPHEFDLSKFNCYKNPELSSKSEGVKFKVVYVVRLNDKGEIVEEIFNRTKLPELKTGMFIKVVDVKTNESFLGYVNIELDRIIYQDGYWDVLSQVIEYDGDSSKIVEVYKCNGFNECSRANLIWQL